MKLSCLQVSRHIIASIGVGLLVGGGITTNSWAQVQGDGTGQAPPEYAPGTIFDPSSSLPLESDAGKRVHTNLKILVPPANAAGGKAQPPQYNGVSPLTPPYSGYFFETPASLACIYQLVPVTVAGCNPNLALTNAATGSKAIAIVDAFDYPAALSDLTNFSKQFGLPAPTSSNFQVVYATGTKPPNGSGTGWDLEAALDIEYAHGLAPKARVYLVEAASNSFNDLFVAVTKASQLVAAAGGGEVSMSWGGSEFSGETSFDSYLTTSTVVYFASSGDSAGTIYPSVSPNVVSVGGTSNSRNFVTGKFQGQLAWEYTGGGPSVYEPRPAYQSPISGIVGSKRGVPDIAAVADPNTGVWVFNSTYNGSPTWYIVGGTSVASPVSAAIVNSSAHFYASSAAELTTIYSTVGTVGAGWNDVTNGACGFYLEFLALPGWDFCTGVGTPQGTSFKVVAH
jgi:kumamolisin